MNDYSRLQAGSVPAGRADMAVDAGLRSFMLGVYNKMALGLVISAALAYASATVDPLRALIFGTPLVYVVMFGPLAILLVSMFTMKNPSPTGANILYWTLVALIGTGLGATLMYYGGYSAATGTFNPEGLYDITKAFLITSAAFGALSLWGYTTKKDISGWGTFLIMGVFGLIIASIVNMFLASSAFSFIISVVGVLLFSGITAWETQRLKYTYYEVAGDARSMAVATTYGALNLYITFINLFRMILSLISSRE
jgi:FtsH-binding integral membrane protein